MLVLRGKQLFPLLQTELLAVLQYKLRDAYDQDLLRGVDTDRPYFSYGHKQHPIFFDHRPLPR